MSEFEPINEVFKLVEARAETVNWVTLESLGMEVSEKCVDGRWEEGAIATPGGNIGEFVLALAAVEDLTAENIDETAVRIELREYINKFGRFYMHTDTHAIDKLTKRINERADDQEQWSYEEVEELIKTGNGLENQDRETLLDLLVGPDGIGCGHLRLMVENPREYKVRKELVQSVIKAFYQEMWAGNENLDFVVLEHDHNEEAVVNVWAISEQDSCFDDEEGVYREEALVPLVKPSVNGASVFVNHPEAIDYMRGNTARFISEWWLNVDRCDLLEAIQRKGDVQRDETLVRLASGLPIFNLVFKCDEESGQFEYEVKYVGKVE